MGRVYVVFSRVADKLPYIDAELRRVLSEIAVKIGQAAALQAPARLVHYLVFRKADLDFHLASCPLMDRKLVHALLFDMLRLGKFTLRNLTESLLTAYETLGSARRLARAYVLVYGGRRRPSVGDRVDGHRGAGYHVTACKNAWDRGGKGFFIDDYRLLAGGLDAAFLIYCGEVDILSYRGDDERGRQVILRPLYRYRAPAAGCVRLTKLHADASQGFELAVFCDDGDGRGEKAHFNAFLGRGVYLHLVGGHFLHGPPVQDDHLFGPNPQRGPGRVDGGVAASHHDHGAVYFRRFRRLHPPQEIDAAEQPFYLLFTVDAHGLRFLRAHGEEDRIEAALFE